MTRSLLRTALRLDAAASGATGLLCLAGAGLLAGPLGLSPGLMRGAGTILVPYALGVAWLAARPAIPRGAALAVIAINVLWALESAALLAGGWASPTALGAAFVLAQAGAVLGFAALQAYALGRPQGAPAHA